MKNVIKFTIYFYLSFIFLTNVFGQTANLCSEKIALKTIGNVDTEERNLSAQVHRMLESLLIASNKCEITSRERLGDLVEYLNVENDILKEYYNLPKSTWQLFIRQDITYIGFIKTSLDKYGKLPTASTKITFYDTFTGAPEIEIEIYYTLDEIKIATSEIVKQRLSEKLASKLDCNRIDEYIAKLRNEIEDANRRLSESLKNQEYDCEKLKEILINFRNTTKGSKKHKDVLKYLEDQDINCDEIITSLSTLERKKRELNEANYQKELEQRQKVAEQEQLNEINEREDFRRVQEEKIRLAESFRIGTKKEIECLSFIPYFITTNVPFKNQFIGKYFIRFATLPYSYYNACDFNTIYNLRRDNSQDSSPYIYLIDQGINESDKSRLISLFGPFVTEDEAKKYLRIITDNYMYRDAYIVNL